MKKLLTLVAICSTIFMSAQTTTDPRFGVGPGKDNTFRVLQNAIITTTDLTQAVLDTITITPNAYNTLVTMKTGTAMTNIADSVCYKFATPTAGQVTYRLGDNVTFLVAKGTGNGKIKFGGSQFILSTASAAVLVNANKTLIMRFIWDGKKWVEVTRMIQP